MKKALPTLPLTLTRARGNPKLNRKKPLNDENNQIYSIFDFTVAKASATPGFSGSNGAVNLNFNHVFTLLEFDLKLASGSSNTSLSSIELYSSDANLSLTSGTIDLTQASPTGDNATRSI